MRQPDYIHTGYDLHTSAAYEITWKFANNRCIVLVVGKFYDNGGALMTRSRYGTGGWVYLSRGNLMEALDRETEMEQAWLKEGSGSYAPAG